MPVTVRIDQGALARVLRARGGLARRSLERRTERVADAARIGAAPHGSMDEHIRVVYTETARGIQGHVILDHPAAGFVNKGTPRHPIRARRAKALRFRSRMTGDIVFRKMVMHPGYKGDPFMTRALRAAR